MVLLRGSKSFVEKSNMILFPKTENKYLFMPI